MFGNLQNCMDSEVNNDWNIDNNVQRSERNQCYSASKDNQSSLMINTKTITRACNAMHQLSI